MSHLGAANTDKKQFEFPSFQKCVIGRCLWACGRDFIILFFVKSLKSVAKRYLYYIVRAYLVYCAYKR